MNTKYIITNICLTLGIIIHTHCIYAQTKPLDLRFTASGPYPINYDAYIDDFPNASLTIRNKDLGKSYEFELYSTISGPLEIFGASNKPHCTQEINPGATRNFPRGSFDDLCINYKLADFDFKNVPGEYISNGILPEGEYEICFTAKEINTGDVLGNVCFKFTIIHPSRPVIDQPKNNQEVDGNLGNNLVLIWHHTLNDARLRASTKYNVKIKDLGLDEAYSDDPNPVTSTILHMRSWKTPEWLRFYLKKMSVLHTI